MLQESEISNIDDRDRAALAAMKRMLGGSLHVITKKQAETMFPAVGQMVASLFAHTALVTRMRGLAAVVLVGLKEWVQSAPNLPFQAIAVVVNGLDAGALLQPVEWKSYWGTVQTAVLGCVRWGLEANSELCWKPIGAVPTTLRVAHGYRFTGCCGGVLFAVCDEPHLDPCRAATALQELASLAAFGWRPPTADEVRAIQRHRVGWERGYLVGAIMLVALSCVVTIGAILAHSLF